MPLPDFHVSDPSTLGIELEMQVVNPSSYDLSQDSSWLIDIVKPQPTTGGVKHDIIENMLEIAIGVYRNIDQADAELSTMQQVTMRAVAEYHLVTCGDGIHPFQKWQHQETCNNERHRRSLENFGHLIQRAMAPGQYVHIGCADDDGAIYPLHGLSRFVPHFIAFFTVSPYIQTLDTRSAYARLNTLSGFPDSGSMPWAND